jgi:hypothetical protein
VLEIVQAPLGHPATQHEKHLHGMNVAVGRQPVSGVVDFEQQGGAAAVVGRITDQGEARQAWSCSGRSSWGRRGIGAPQESGFMVLGLADRVSGLAMAMAMAMAESTPLGPLRAPGSP